MKTYQELIPIRQRLNFLYKGNVIPDTEFIVKDFVIMPDAFYDLVTHKDVLSAFELGVPLQDIELAVKNHPYLEIRILLKNKRMNGCYKPQELGLTILDILNLKFKLGTEKN